MRVLDAVAKTWGASVADMDEAAIVSARSRVKPPKGPITRVTGAILAGVDITTAEAPSRDGHGIPLRLYRPQQRPDPLPVIAFFHGGGWVLGSVSGYDPLCTYLADAVGALVVSVDYRLAPEHPAPAGVEDCHDATRWLGAHAAELGGDAARMAVCGDSAGGNLAAVVAQLLRDDGRTDPAVPRLRHQALIYPSLDSTRLTRSKMKRARGPILTRRDTDAYLALYLGTGPTALPTTDPRISPARGVLDGLPPALIQTADLDPLRDEGLAYAEALRAHGIEATYTNYPGAVHGFASFPGVSPDGWAHRVELTRELTRHLHDD